MSDLKLDTSKIFHEGNIVSGEFQVVSIQVLGETLSITCKNVIKTSKILAKKI